MGEQQITLNYTRTLSDYITNFCFGKGVQFRSPEQNAAIIPSLLKKVWEQDNNKHFVLWEMGQLAGVTGDCFVKIAYEDPWVDGIGVNHEGRTRIIPLNPAHCFPEYHPHDRDRLLRFKLKYRCWGTSPEGTRQVYCVDDQTEILTKRGWLRHYQIEDGDETLGVDPITKVMTWQPIMSVHRFDYDDDLVHWHNAHGFDALTTPNHRWLTEHRDRDGYNHWDAPARFMETHELSGGNKQIITSGGEPQCFASSPTFSDEFVELIGWAVTEGHYQVAPAKTGVVIAQSETHNPGYVDRLRYLVKHFADQGATATEMQHNRTAPEAAGSRDFYFGRSIGNLIREIAPQKELTSEFLCALTLPQARLLYETLLDGDGHRAVLRNDVFNRTVQTENFIQKDSPLIAGFQMLAAMLGRRSAAKEHSVHPGIYNTTVYARPVTTARHLQDERVHYKGTVWCPRTSTGTWMARRNGGTYLTGNTFTEILTDDAVEQYINDELIDQYENPIGTIPIVHIPNTTITSSPWGQSDIWDIIPLNRELNEKATEVSDIVNYHAAPVTIITGAKASQLERGAKKVWAGLPKDAQVFNLESSGEMAGAMEYIQFIKVAMHELTGVPQTALGEAQPISNTSGVALAIQYQPMMNRWSMKRIHFTKGLQRVNELIIRTQAVHEPETLVWSEGLSSIPEPGALYQLDPTDPATYRTEVHWPEPLPVDVLIKLNELQAKMAIGLESKRGALAELGEEFPNEKMAEIFEELRDDALDQGALDMLKAQIANAVMSLTGMVMGGDGAEPADVPSAGGSDVSTGSPSGGSGVLPGTMPKPDGEVVNQLVQRAYGANLAQRRVPSEE